MDRIIDWIDATPFRRVLACFAPGGLAFAGGWGVLEPLGVTPGFHTTVSLILFSGLAVLGGQVVLARRRLRRYELGNCRSRQLLDTRCPTLRQTVGVIAPLSTWTTDFYRNLVAGIRMAADRESPDLQRRIIVFDVPKESYQSVADLATFTALENTVDGVISVNIRLPDDLIARLRNARIPVLNVFHEENGPPFIGNIVPNHSAFRELLESLLVSQAAKPALLVTKPLENPYKEIKADPYRKDKREAFLDTATRAGLRILNGVYHLDSCNVLKNEDHSFAAIIEVDEYNLSVGDKLFESCLDCLPENTAVVCLADVVAAGIILSAERSGRSCKQRHLRIIGFDNTPLSEELDLTTIDYRLDLVGRLAYDKIQTAIELGITLNTTTDHIDTQYVERGSNRW